MNPTTFLSKMQAKRRIIKITILAFILAQLTSCTKTDSKKWVVDYSEIINGCLIEVNNNYESSIEPLEHDTSCIGNLFIENQLIKRSLQEDIRQTIFFELPSDTNSFYYESLEIPANLKLYVYNSNRYTYYRMMKGWIRGEFIDGQFIIDFDLHYGGENLNLYHIKKGANY
jgi:hypothetical protein